MLLLSANQNEYALRQLCAYWRSLFLPLWPTTPHDSDSFLTGHQQQVEVCVGQKECVGRRGLALLCSNQLGRYGDVRVPVLWGTQC